MRLSGPFDKPSARNGPSNARSACASGENRHYFERRDGEDVSSLRGRIARLLDFAPSRSPIIALQALPSTRVFFRSLWAAPNRSRMPHGEIFRNGPPAPKTKNPLSSPARFRKTRPRPSMVL